MALLNIEHLHVISFFSGVPRCLRMDAGTENVDVIDMQKSFRWYHGDSYAGENSVIVGSSHSNQVNVHLYLTYVLF